MTILQMSISAALPVTALILIRVAALQRLPKTMFVVLWGLALTRLLTPFSIPPPFSIYSILGRAFYHTAPQAAAPLGESMLPSGIPALQAAGAAGSTALSGLTAAVGQIAPALLRPTPGLSPLALIWLAGLLVLVIFLAFMNGKNYRELRLALPIRSNGFIEGWLGKHRLRRGIAILQSEQIATPLAVGLLKPRIILPKSLNMDDHGLLHYVLTHEYYHIRRFDTLWRVLLAAALCIHWFNPLVWLMYILANRDLELSCDEMAVRACGEAHNAPYALALISLAEKGSRFRPVYNSFSKSHLEERIVSIMKIKKTSRLGLLAAVLVVVIMGVFFLTSAAATSIMPDIPASSTISNYQPGDRWDTIISGGYRECMLFVSKGEAAVKITYDGSTWEPFDIALEKQAWIWYTYDEYKEYADSIMKFMRANPDLSQERQDIVAARLEQTLLDIKNGIKVSREKTIFILSPGPQANRGGLHSFDGILPWSCYGYSFKDKAGKEVDLGLFETRGLLFAALKGYYDQEVAAGRISQAEADGLYNNIAHLVRWGTETTLADKLANQEIYLQ